MWADVETMREAIKDAKATLGILESVRKKEQAVRPNTGVAMELSLISDILAKLQPFLKP